MQVGCGGLAAAGAAGSNNQCAHCEDFGFSGELHHQTNPRQSLERLPQHGIVRTVRCSEDSQTMARNMQVILCVTLILACIHPALGYGQSQKSQIWQVPVLPLIDVEKASPSTGGVWTAPSGQRKNFENLLEPVPGLGRSASELGINATRVGMNPSLSQTINRAGVAVLGGEAARTGGGRFVMRGHPGQEPVVSVEGVPLSSGFSGAHSEELIPLSAVQEIRIYPFAAPPGFFRLGVSGGYDLSVIKGQQVELRERRLVIEQPSAISMSQRESLGCQSRASALGPCLHFSWQAGRHLARQKVFDDNNTPSEMSDDKTILLPSNDINQVALLLDLQRVNSDGLKFNSLFFSGADSRQLVVLPVVENSHWNRLYRDIILASQEAEFLSPLSGFFWRARLGGRIENARFTAEKQDQSRQIRSDSRKEDVAVGHFFISLPVQTSGADLTPYINFNVENNHFESLVGLIEPTSSTATLNTKTQNKTDSRIQGVMARANVGFGAEVNAQRFGFLRVESFLQAGQSRINFNCGVYSSEFLCAQDPQAFAKIVPGYVIEYRKQLSEKILLFTSSGQTLRLPTPVEISGRPDGILGNSQLIPEQTQLFESGLQSPFGKISVFAARDANLITARQLSPVLIRYENTFAAQRVGYHALASVQSKHWFVELNLEGVWSRVLQGRAQQRVLTFVPESQLGFRLARQLVQEIPFKDGEIALEISKSGPYWLDEGQLSRLTPPFLVNLSFALPTRLAGGKLQSSFRIANIFDNRTSLLALSGQAPRTVAWSYSPILPISGRTFELSFRLLDTAGPG